MDVHPARNPNGMSAQCPEMNSGDPEHWDSRKEVPCKKLERCPLSLLRILANSAFMRRNRLDLEIISLFVEKT